VCTRLAPWQSKRVTDIGKRLNGTFAPFLRASLSQMAIACLRLVTRLPRVHTAGAVAK